MNPECRLALGVLRSRPYLGGGKANLQAALAHFRDAASRGDKPSATELGILTSLGAGVSADEAKARSLLERGSDPASANPSDLFLAMNLMADARKSGDHNTALRAMELVQRVANTAENKTLKAESYVLLANFWLNLLPPDMQDQHKAFENFLHAFEIGSISAAGPLAVLYREGRGVDRDVIRGYAYALVLDMENEQKLAIEIKKGFAGLLDDRQLAEALKQAKQIQSHVSARLSGDRDGTARAISGIVPNPSVPVFRRSNAQP